MPENRCKRSKFSTDIFIEDVQLALRINDSFRDELDALPDTTDTIEQRKRLISLIVKLNNAMQAQYGDDWLDQYAELVGN